MNKKKGCLFSLIGFVILLLLVADYRLPICPFPWRGRNGTFYCYTRCYSEENNGIPFCLPGKSMTTRKGNEFLFPETPTALFPGLPLLLLEQFVICPVIDTVMIPYDLYLQSQKSAICKEEGILIKVQDRSGRPIQGLEIDLAINGKPGHQIFYGGKACPKGAYGTHVFTNEKGEAYVPIDLSSCGTVRFSGSEQTSVGNEDFGGTTDAAFWRRNTENDWRSDERLRRPYAWYMFACSRCDSEGVSEDMWSTNGICVKCGWSLSKKELRRRQELLARWERQGRSILPAHTKTGYMSLCGRTGLSFEVLEGIFGECPPEDGRKRIFVRLKGEIDPAKLSRNLPNGIEFAKGTSINDHLIKHVPMLLNMTVGLAIRKEFNTIKLPEKVPDFDSFWDVAKKEMRKGWNGTVKMEEIPDMSTASSRVSRVEFDIAGRSVVGILFEPRDDASRSLVPTLAFFSRGRDPDVHGLAVPTNGTVLYLSAFPPGYDHFRAEHDIRQKYHLGPNAQLDAYAIDGIDQGREAYFFYPILSGALRAAEWLAYRENAKGVRCVGTDQGASLAVMLAALSDHVVMVEAYHPEFVGIEDDRNAWPSFYWHERSRLMGEVRKWIPYYELCSFARRVECPTTLYLNMHETPECRRRNPSLSTFKALERCEGRKLVIDNSLKSAEALRKLVLQ